MPSIDYMAQHHKAKLDRVAHYLRFNNVSNELKNKILSYYKYISLNSQSSEDLSDCMLPGLKHLGKQLSAVGFAALGSHRLQQAPTGSNRIQQAVPSTPTRGAPIAVRQTPTFPSSCSCSSRSRSTAS